MNVKFEINQAVFTYFIGEEQELDGFLRTPIYHGTQFLHHTPKTEVQIYTDDENEVCVIGLCVDAYGVLTAEGIGKRLLQSCKDGIDQVYQQTNRFAGHYVICCTCQTGQYIIGDATSSVPVYYTVSGQKACISSLDYLIASSNGFQPDPYYLEIRKGSSYSQAMPFDATIFHEIKALLPNHYLDLETRKSVRCPLPMENNRTDDEVIDHSINLIRTITKAYAKKYQLICPITSGYDSRIVFSFLNEIVPHLKSYTFRHPGFTDQTGDLLVANQICSSYGIAHEIVLDEKADQEALSYIAKYTGPYFASGTVDLAVTIVSHFSGYAIVNGNIVGQIGKHMIGNTLPTCFGTPGFFQCKIHNRNPNAKREMEQYLKEMGEEHKVHAYDLFAWENRCGRWGAQGSGIYALCGISSLNIFNCRDLICGWIQIAPKKRVNHFVHRSILQKMDQNLLLFPFNPEDKRGWIKKTPILFLLATYLKQYLSKSSEVSHEDIDNMRK